MFAIAPLLPGFHPIPRILTIGTGPELLVRPDPRRPILFVSNSTAEDLYLWMTRSEIDTDCPHLIVPSRSVHRMTWSLDGPMATFGWSAAFQTAGGDVSVIEVLWHPDQLIGGYRGE